MAELPVQTSELVIRPHSLVSLADLRDVFRYRELLWTLASRDISVRYKQAFFGIAWAVIQPLVQMLVFTLLFNRMAGITADSGVAYPLFSFAGAVIWGLFAAGLQQASNSLVENTRVITKVYFPRIVMPLASIVVAAVDFAIGLALLLAILPIFDVVPPVTALLIPLFAAMASLCAFAGGVWLSAINLQFRDVRYALPFFLQLLIFITPVFYPSSLVPEPYRALVYLNPMAPVVDGFRGALFGTAIPWDRIGIGMAIALVVALTGFLYFRRMEQTFADRV